MENITNTYNPSFQQRVNYLINSLTFVRTAMDEVSCEIDDYNLSSALSAIASDSCRYISEIFIECKRFGMPININDNTAIPSFLDYDNSSFNAGLSSLVEKNEFEIEKAYSTLLNEPYPFLHLKELMNHQFISLKSAFSKLKILSTSRIASNI